MTTAQPLHASCIALEGRGLLILGPSGAGKSALALHLMALGAVLVADDRVLLRAAGGQLWASAPPQLAGLIEARGTGILRAPALPEVALHLVADLAQDEPDRLPPRRHICLAGVELPLALRVAAPHFPSALLHWLRHGREA